MLVGSVVLGIDLGGSSCKAVLLDETGQTVSGPSVGYPTHRGERGEVVQDPDDWEAATCQAVRGALALETGADVCAMALTAPAHAVVLLGVRGLRRHGFASCLRRR